MLKHKPLLNIRILIGHQGLASLYILIGVEYLTWGLHRYASNVFQERLERHGVN